MSTQPLSPPDPAADGEITWEGLRRALNDLAIRRKFYFGYPMPHDDLKLAMSPRANMPNFDGFSLQEVEEKPPPASIEQQREAMRALLEVMPQTDVPEGIDDPEQLIDLLIAQAQAKMEFVNAWYSEQHQRVVYVYRNSLTGKVRHVKGKYRHAEKLTTLLQTLNASRSWDHMAEARAMLKLQSMVSSTAFHYYFTTGMFLETSPRSGICYIFRRLRPTIAVRFVNDSDSRILITLCMHALGHYENTFAGVMVPTDDVIAHLLMMRADERRFWAACNQHPPEHVVGGL